MKRHKLSDMHGGWIVGDFEPSLHKANYEVAVKRYSTGDSEKKHHHKLATEFTVVISGSVSMNDEVFNAGDIVEVSANEDVKFFCVEEAVTVVVKTTSSKNDKYITE